MAGIPDEDDITKQDLWRRTNSILETIQTVSQNAADNAQSIIPALQRDYNAAIINFKHMQDDSINDLKAYIDTKLKFSEKINNDAATGMTTQQMAFRDSVDTRLRSISEDIEAKVHDEITKAFEQLSNTFNDFMAKVTEYKKQSDTQIAIVQAEVNTKMGEILGRFEDMRKRFKKITEQLQ